MQISRPTLREAVKVLAEAGVVDVTSGRGGGMVVASEFVPRELVRTRSELRVGEVGGVLEARRLLEPRVAQLAALHATDDDFAAMQLTIERQRVLMGSRESFMRHEDRFLQLDVRFHLAIARATRNATIVQLMRTLLRQLEIARDMALHVPLMPEWTIDIHERTAAAIRAADPDEIEAVMDEHLGRVEQTWQEETGRPLTRPLPDFLRPVAERADAARRR